ncbi:MAG: antibiotic biosynthesis monooxygenase [Longimicrobiales bacterium]
MVVRTWRGRTRLEDVDAYLEYLEGTGLREYRATPGNRGVQVLRRDVGNEAEFLILSTWDSMDAVRKFAGPTPDKAVFYPEDDRYLTDFDRDVRHYELLFQTP